MDLNLLPLRRLADELAVRERHLRTLAGLTAPGTFENTSYEAALAEVRRLRGQVEATLAQEQARRAAAATAARPMLAALPPDTRALAEHLAVVLGAPVLTVTVQAHRMVRMNLARSLAEAFLAMIELRRGQP